MNRWLAQLLEALIEREYNQLLELPESQSGIRPAGDGSWSPREELGHLIDSAINNHVRIVCASVQPEFHGASYAQNAWVAAHGYQHMPWLTITEFWLQQNALLVRVLERIPEEKLQTPCFVGSGDAVTLQFLVEDFVLHAQHHIDHLLGREQVTAYPRR
jgi:hypothetical protein